MTLPFVSDLLLPCCMFLGFHVVRIADVIGPQSPYMFTPSSGSWIFNGLVGGKFKRGKHEHTGVPAHDSWHQNTAIVEYDALKVAIGSWRRITKESSRHGT